MARVRNYDRINAFVQHAIDIANDDSHGYSQYHRWGPDYDCSSMMYECAYFAGYDVSREDPRYTGAMIDDFTAVGYRCDAFDGNLWDLEKGDILLNTSAHTAVYIGDGMIAEASIDEYGGIAGDNYGDQTGQEIHIRSVYNYPWTHVLTPPADYDDIPEPEHTLYGIDVSSHDEAPFKWHTESCYNDSDFVIVKTTQGTWYENPCFDYAYNRAKADGKLLGIYHYAGDEGAREEAEYFYEHVKGYIGEFIPVLDWESYNNEGNWGNTSWCREFVNRFHELSGVWCMIYVQASAIWQCDNCASDCALWVAGYPSWTGDNWNVDPDDMPYSLGAWDAYTVWQFTSDGGTDRNVANIGAEAWQRIAAGSGTPQPTPTPTPSGDAPESISYAVKTSQDGWLPFVSDLSDYAGIPGHAAIYLAVNMHGHGWYQVKSQSNGWLEPVRNCDVNDYEYGCAGDGSPILAVRVYYETQNPGSTGWWRAKYRTSNLNAGYYDWQYDDETGGGQDGYAGDGYNAIDRVQITLAR